MAAAEPDFIHTGLGLYPLAKFIATGKTGTDQVATHQGDFLSITIAEQDRADVKWIVHTDIFAYVVGDLHAYRRSNIALRCARFEATALSGGRHRPRHRGGYGRTHSEG